MIAAKLDAAVRAVCPIHGISIGRADDKATWRIDFKEEATTEQRTDAEAVKQAFDPEAPLTAAELETQCQQRFDADKLFRAKCLSDLAFRLGKAPGQLTATDIENERARLAAIYRAL